MADTITSRSGAGIRLTYERWPHIIEEHGAVSGIRALVLNPVEAPDRVLAGASGELLAVRETEPGKWLIVVNRQSGDDGCIITAFLTRRRRSLDRRQSLWP